MASGDSLLEFRTPSATLPTSSAAGRDTRNTHPVLDFDADAEESCYFTGRLPSHYAGGGLTFIPEGMASSATSGDVVLGISIERLNTGGHDLDSDSFASEKTATATANGTSGVLFGHSIAFASGAEMDSLAAEEGFRIKVARKATDAGDTMTGDYELSAIYVKET